MSADYFDRIAAGEIDPNHEAGHPDRRCSMGALSYFQKKMAKGGCEDWLEHIPHLGFTDGEVYGTAMVARIACIDAEDRCDETIGLMQCYGSMRDTGRPAQNGALAHAVFVMSEIFNAAVSSGMAFDVITRIEHERQERIKRDAEQDFAVIASLLEGGAHDC